MSKTTSRSIALGLLFMSIAFRRTGDARMAIILAGMSVSIFLCPHLMEEGDD